MSSLDAIIHRQDATAWDRFMSSPLIFLARWLHLSDAVPSAASSTPDILPRIRLVCISDTHNTHHAQPHLPEGDILIHAGDLTQSGTAHELDDALAWLSSHPHPHKLFIAGNHDVALASPHAHARIPPSLTYLENSFVDLTISGRKLRIYGSPYTPKHGSWPFQYPRVRPALTAPPQPDEPHEIWSKIPPLTDILITHGPPLAHLDADRYGCHALLFALWHVRPKLHVFGHVHAGRGVERIKWDRAQMAYENICAGRTGWGGLVELLWYKLTAWLWKRSSGDHDVGTLLVNAAAVAGLRDDQKKVHDLPWVQNQRRGDPNGSGNGYVHWHGASGTEITFTAVRDGYNCTRIPVNGFKDLEGSDGPPRFTIRKAGDIDQLSKNSTSFNRIYLPPYNDYASLYHKLTLTVEGVSL